MPHLSTWQHSFALYSSIRGWTAAHSICAFGTECGQFKQNTGSFHSRALPMEQHGIVKGLESQRMESTHGVYVARGLWSMAVLGAWCWCGVVLVPTLPRRSGLIAMLHDTDSHDSDHESRR